MSDATKAAYKLYFLKTKNNTLQPCITKLSCVCEFVFNVPPTAKVIWRQGHSLESHPTDWRSQLSNSGPQVVYPPQHCDS